jgi:hypothetical protein
MRSGAAALAALVALAARPLTSSLAPASATIDLLPALPHLRPPCEGIRTGCRGISRRGGAKPLCKATLAFRLMPVIERDNVTTACS